jgi:oxygen-independent coproporphyrinogen-3 oxidase
MLPGRDEKIDIFRQAMSQLTAAGYTYVGMDHFARPEDELCVAQRNGTLHRNFQGYTTKAGADLIGFGVTSIGEVNRAYLQNWRDIDHWREAVDGGVLPIMRGFELSDDDVIRRAAISAILCQTIIDKAQFTNAYGIDFDAYFADAIAKLQPLAADGLVEITSAAVRVTPLGRVFLRNIAMAFDAYLKPESDRPMFSRTV